MLRDLQAAFADALISDIGAATASTNKASAIIRAGALPAARRLEIYRHNVLSNLRGALGDIYPAVKAIVGEAFFNHAAAQFIVANPSRSGDLNQFGQSFATFLTTYPHAVDLPYLADVAGLEWAWHESFHAADHAPLELARLAEIPPELYSELRFQLHSSVRLQSSRFALFRIWEVNQADYAGPLDVDWSVGGDHLLVQRDGVEVAVRRLPETPYRFLAALATGAKLEDAAEPALEADPDFDLQGFLLEAVQSGVIVNFTLEQS